MLQLSPCQACSGRSIRLLLPGGGRMQPESSGDDERFAVFAPHLRVVVHQAFLGSAGVRPMERGQDR